MIFEIEGTSNGNPPGVGGMATTSPTTWYRLDGGPWQRATAGLGVLRIRDEILKLLHDSDPSGKSCVSCQRLWDTSRFFHHTTGGIICQDCLKK